MPLYEVYVYCDKCGQPHEVHVQLTLEDPELHGKSLTVVFSNGELPSQITFMQTNKYRCPHTKQLFPASDIDNAILVRTEQ
jgi:hypothetical protein